MLAGLVVDFLSGCFGEVVSAWQFAEVVFVDVFRQSRVGAGTFRVRVAPACVLTLSNALGASVLNVGAANVSCKGKIDRKIMFVA